MRANAGGGTTVTVFLAQGLTEDSSAAAAAAAAQAVTVAIVDCSFEPVDLEVVVGATVTWTNEGPTDHTATAYDNGDKLWDSGILAAGESFPPTFDDLGSFEYLCTLYPTMTARLDVVA